MSAAADQVIAALREAREGLVFFDPGDKLAYSIQDAASFAGVDATVIRAAVSRRDIVPSYVGAKPLIKIWELRRWLKSLPVAHRRR
ncbi:hypothetical protein ACFOYW_16380 [Gryllotalpicola reticulitermitis]|uniref:DNA-binding protein n=1 Tax=Gryllotalpicola reticulitermitis TaxID=1184153 RepID=A0ABV8QBA6_9MICO